MTTRHKRLFGQAGATTLLLGKIVIASYVFKSSSTTLPRNPYLVWQAVRKFGQVTYSVPGELESRDSRPSRVAQRLKIHN